MNNGEKIANLVSSRLNLVIACLKLNFSKLKKTSFYFTDRKGNIKIRLTLEREPEVTAPEDSTLGVSDEEIPIAEAAALPILTPTPAVSTSVTPAVSTPVTPAPEETELTEATLKGYLQVLRDYNPHNKDKYDLKDHMHLLRSSTTSSLTTNGPTPESEAPKASAPAMNFPAVSTQEIITDPEYTINYWKLSPKYDIDSLDSSTASLTPNGPTPENETPKASAPAMNFPAVSTQEIITDPEYTINYWKPSLPLLTQEVLAMYSTSNVSASAAETPTLDLPATEDSAKESESLDRTTSPAQT